MPLPRRLLAPFSRPPAIEPARRLRPHSDVGSGVLSRDGLGRIVANAVLAAQKDCARRAAPGHDPGVAAGPDGRLSSVWPQAAIASRTAMVTSGQSGVAAFLG
jgi:hypothetical protein